MRSAIAAGCALALLLPAPTSHAFCGFYVSGSNKKMFNDATNVVLMRSGTRTVLAMQNDYRGPLEDFAMVVPVPVVLKPTDVKVVPKAIFDRVDQLGAPRLVEYWEQDPCPQLYDGEVYATGMAMDMAGAEGGIAMPSPPSPVMVKSARPEPKKAPERMAVAPILKSFSASPTTVTANVPSEITWSFGYANEPWPAPHCTVSHGGGTVYPGTRSKITLEATSDVTLRCANSAGVSSKSIKISAVKVEAKFDVQEYQIVILSATEAAGLQEWLKLNSFKIPDGAEPLLRPYIESGSKFFVAKVDPKKVAVVDGRVALSPLRFHYDSEEFSLPIRLGMANSSGKQDLIVNIISPDKRYEVANYKNVFIPTNINVLPLVKDRFAEFYASLFDKTIEANPGAVVTEYAWTTDPRSGIKCDPCPPELPQDADMMQLGADVIGGTVATGGYVLTRLHARYSAADMKDDLRFKEAKPVVGGREVMTNGWLEYGATPAPTNNFQGRYAVRHWWTGPIKCANPQRQVWGGPPDGGSQLAMPATKTAFAPRGSFQLGTVIHRDLWEINFKRTPSTPAPAKAAPPATPKKAVWFGIGLLAGTLLIGASLRRRASA